MRYLAAILCVLLIPQTALAIYTGETQQAQPEFAATRLIVKLKPEVDRQVVLGKIQGKVVTGLSRLDNLNSKFRVLEQKKLFADFQQTALKSERLSSVYILQVPEGTDLEKMQREYENAPEVEYAELDYKVVLFEEPNDPLFPNQWSLNNTGQGYLGMNRLPGDYNDTQVIKYGTEDADIDALEAFERDDETTVPLIGMIDTGVDLDHEDLADNIWTNPAEIPDNGIDDDHNGFVDDFYGWDFSGDTSSAEPVGDNDPTDYYGHGTHCAGIAAGVRDNFTGISGITTPCKVMAIKFFPNSYFSLGAKSIVYAADMGCDMISMSWGSIFASKLQEDALDYAVERGVLPIAAAGNSGAEDYFYPSSLPQVFAVGASNSDDEVTDFSTYGNHIKVVAPGQDILSLRADNTDMYAEGGGYGIEPYVHIVQDHYYLADGTSMAAPCVAGVAAYTLAISPGLSTERLRDILEQSADDLIYPFGGDTLYSPGKDIYSGYGRVNVNSALQLASGRLAKIDYPYKNAIVSGDVAVVGTASGQDFLNYVLEYGEGYSPEEWIEISSSDMPVSKDTLGIWNTFGLTGRYTLRLTVGDQNQATVHVVVDNDVLVKIISPSDGDTVIGHAEVRGFTVVPDFSHYILEYGYGESPSSWIAVDTSTKMIADDVLGVWYAWFLEESGYALRLIVETNGGQVYGDTVIVALRSVASETWEVDLVSFGSLSPAVGDIDGDGYNEIVVGVGGPAGWGRVGGTEVFTHDGQRETGWPRDADKNMMSSPALGDLDGDGVDDIVVCCEEVGVRAYLSSSPDWSRYAEVEGNDLWCLATPLIADLENDGALEVLTINKNGLIRAWRNDGQAVIPGSNGQFALTGQNSDIGFPSVVVADLDRDGENEVISATSTGGCNPPPCWAGGGIWIFDIDGNALLRPSDYQIPFINAHGIAIANVDENKDLEVIFSGGDTTLCIGIYAFKKDGTQATNYPIILERLDPEWWFANHPAIGDLEGDGILEIIVSMWAFGEGRIYGWHQDGTPLGSPGSSGLLASVKSPHAERMREVLYTLGNTLGEVVARVNSMSKEELASLFTDSQDPVFASASETLGSPVLADINRDGNLEIVARAGCFSSIGYERVFAWDYEGNLIPGFPLYASSVSSANTYWPFTPVVTDVDNDGMLDIVVNSCRPFHYRLVYWEFETYYDSTRAHWPKYMHDKYNGGVFRLEDYASWPGDANGDGVIDIADVVYLLNYLYKGDSPPDPLESGDANRDGVIDLADVVYLINYLFRQGEPPCF